MGLALTSNVISHKTPVMSMPLYLKLAALIVTLAGLFTALDLARLTNKQYKPSPTPTPHHFSNMLGLLPALLHRLTPKINLALGQLLASQTLDQAWLEKVGPKAAETTNKPLAASADSLQHGAIKTYLSLFLLTLSVTALLLLVYTTRRLPRLSPRVNSKTTRSVSNNTPPATISMLPPPNISSQPHRISSKAHPLSRFIRVHPRPLIPAPSKNKGHTTNTHHIARHQPRHSPTPPALRVGLRGKSCTVSKHNQHASQIN
ncbi:uncharacterized protein LOC114459059 [Gouania willdenowi]|uniref:uncharacterized protein LOC114459059 n=1 Tax=Gouania willdenowi TaxID=441366 RepID=UPI0010564656|nr:uncharacterized protein LOC114459059 [Gouania willdenowi]